VIWLAHSPDLNPPEIFMWGFMNREVVPEESKECHEPERYCCAVVLEDL
jgi:hypothetical protein